MHCYMVSPDVAMVYQIVVSFYILTSRKRGWARLPLLSVSPLILYPTHLLSTTWHAVLARQVSIHETNLKTLFI